MKRIIVLTLLIIVQISSDAQQCSIARIDSIAGNFKVRKSILVLFERLHTDNAVGRKSIINRFYYFDQKQRKVSSVREYENSMKPKKGTQVIYTYIDNRLARVTVILPRSECVSCRAEYYYSDDTLFAKKEKCYANLHPESFIKLSHYFQSKLPGYLPWGFFQNEVFMKGKMKKIKNRY
jgi:hypothetical protein